MINPTGWAMSGCRIVAPDDLAAGFSFRATDPVTNAPVGQLNAPVDIDPGASRTFVFAVTPARTQEVRFTFTCDGAGRAPDVPGVNTLRLTTSPVPTGDVVALAVTANHDGIVRLPGPTGAAAFAVATANVGVPERVTIRADTGDHVELPVTLHVCATDPATAQCLAPPAASVTVDMDAGEVGTFAVFVTGANRIRFVPELNRVFVRVEAIPSLSPVAGDLLRGATSVAVVSD
jgi:hypothetical protein